MTLSEACKLIVDCPHSTAKDEGTGYPLIRTPNIGRGRLILDSVQRVSKAVYDKRNARAIPQAGDLIFAREAPAGNIAVIQDGQEVCLGQRTVLLRPNPEVADSDFLAYYLLLPEQQYRLIGTANGATVAHVNLPVIRNLEISIPSIDIQKRMAGVLKAHDDLIENNQKQIKLLEDAAQRLYKEWFVDLHFPGYEDVKVVDGVPDGWKIKPLSEIANVVMGQSPKSEYYNTSGEGLPFHQGVGSYGTRFVKNEVFSSSFTRVAEAGSILFSVRAPVGRLNITREKIAIGRGLSAINSKQGLQSFIFYLLKNKFFKDDIVGNGAIFSSITKNELLEQKFLIPDEMTSRLFDVVVKEVDKKIECLDSQINYLTEARDRLLPKLMSGEIEV